jgi:hypothetical protein
MDNTKAAIISMIAIAICTSAPAWGVPLRERVGVELEATIISLEKASIEPFENSRIIVVGGGGRQAPALADAIRAIRGLPTHDNAGKSIPDGFAPGGFGGRGFAPGGGGFAPAPNIGVKLPAARAK